MAEVGGPVADALHDRDLALVVHRLDARELRVQSRARGQTEHLARGDVDVGPQVVVPPDVARHDHVEPVVATFEHQEHEDAVGGCAAVLVQRYAARWSIEQAFAGTRNILGGGEARTRARRAVERTVPFALLVHTLVITWYARHGHDPADIASRRASQPWYQSKTEPAFEDMLTKLRRVLITARISAGSAAQPEPAQITAVLAAWTAAAARPRAVRNRTS